MYLGRVVESGPTEEVLTAPQHPYTQALLSVVPEIERLEPVVLRGEIPDPTRIPGGCRFHPRCPALGRRARPTTSPTPAAARRCRCLLRRTPRATAVPATWWRRGPPTRLGERGERMTPAGRAAARAVRRPRGLGARARAGAAARVDLRRPGRRPRAATSRSGSPSSRSLGESLLVTVGRGRRAARGVQRLPAPRLPAVPDRAGLRAAAVRGEVDPLPLPLVDLRPRRLAAAGAAHRGRRVDAAGVPPAPGRGRGLGRLRVRAPDPGRRRAAGRQRRPGRRARSPTTTSPSLVTGLTLTYDVAANWKVIAENYNECYHCGPVHPELSRLVPSFAGGGRGLDWDAGIPHREGAWTFTMTGTTDRAPLPGLDEDERTRHKGELVYPNLMLSCSADHVAAFALRTAGGGPDRDRLPAAVRTRRRRRSRSFDPSRRGRLLGPGQPPGLGDLRVGAARDVLARLHARLVRADGGRLRRHPPLAAAQAGAGGWTETSTTSSSGSARSAVRRGVAAGDAAGYSVVGLEQFELGHGRGASHDTSRILRHSYHTPAYVRLTAGGVRRLGAARGGVRRATWSRSSAGSTCSRPTARSARSTTSTRSREVGIAFEELDVDRDPAPVAAVPPAARDTGALPGARRDRAGRAGDRGDAAARAPPPERPCSAPRRSPR